MKMNYIHNKNIFWTNKNFYLFLYCLFFGVIFSHIGRFGSEMPFSIFGYFAMFPLAYFIGRTKIWERL
jgi:hypothetical protein